MTVEAIKVDLHDKIDHAAPDQLKDLYGLIVNYFNGNTDEAGWETLSEPMRAKLTKSIEQADAGLGISAKDAISNIKAKYGLNG